MKFCLIQNPYKISLSSQIYNNYFKEIGLNYNYEDINIDPKDFNRIIPIILKEYNYINITNPYKSNIIDYINIDENSKIIEAVNCIKNGRGYNTDYVGFINSLNYDLKEPILLLGAGGIAKAILYALNIINIKNIFILNRSLDKAEYLRNKYKNINISIDILINIKKYIKKTKTLINCTNLGMIKDQVDLSNKEIKNFDLVYDCVYNNTYLQKLSKFNNVKLIDGERLWYYQAIENLKLWNIYKNIEFLKVFNNFIKTRK